MGVVFWEGKQEKEEKQNIEGFRGWRLKLFL